VELQALLGRWGREADVLAGGTDLLPNYKLRLNPKQHVIALQGIDGLRRLERGYLGALVRLVEIERNDELRAQLPVLVETARAISSPPLREHGTVGGNLMLDTRCWFFNQGPLWRESKDHCLKAEGTQCLVVPSSSGRCYATYSGELAAALLVLQAEAELLGADGQRTVPLRELWEDDGIVRLRAPEPAVLLGVRIPEPPPAFRASYLKLRQRDSIDFPSLGVAVGVAVDPAGRVKDLRVATTAMVSRPECWDEVCAPFLGRPATPNLARELGDAVRQQSRAYKNVPLDPAYRKKMVAPFIRRLLARLDPRFAP
jgi:4-hydroxybenzoyl-CoA reductase subunit beta